MVWVSHHGLVDALEQPAALVQSYQQILLHTQIELHNKAKESVKVWVRLCVCACALMLQLYLHFVFLAGVRTQQGGCGLDVVGELRFGQLSPK